MKKLSAIIITLVMMFSLAACESKNSSLDSNTNEPPIMTPEPTVTSEPTATPPSEKISISIGYAPDEIPSGEYHFFKDEYAYYGVDKVIFSTNTAAKDFKFIEVGVNAEETDLQYFEVSILCSLEELLPEKPLLVTYVGNGLVPHRGISFLDKNNTKRYFYLPEGKAESNSRLIEFENKPPKQDGVVGDYSLFDGVIFSKDSSVEINWKNESGIETAGQEYNFYEIPKIAENKNDILTLSINNYENNIEITSLDFMANFENLQEVDFTNCDFSDNAVLPKMNQLKSVRFYNCNLTDLNIVKNNPQITNLGASYCEISDISVLADFTDLVSLGLFGNNVSDLSPVSNAKNLESIMLLDGNFEIKSLKPLYGLEKLQAIMISDAVRVNLPQDELDYFNYPDGILQVD